MSDVADSYIFHPNSGPALRLQSQYLLRIARPPSIAGGAVEAGGGGGGRGTDCDRLESVRTRGLSTSSEDKNKDEDVDEDDKS